MAAKKPLAADSMQSTHNVLQVAFNSIETARNMLSRGLGELFGGRRNLYETFGYTPTFSYDEGLKRYRRLGIVSRVVNAYPDAIWSRPPTFLEGDSSSGRPGPLDEAMRTLNKATSLYTTVCRADKLSGVGAYSVILLGFDDVSDNTKLRNPVQGNVGLAYVQPYGYGQCRVLEWEDNANSPYFGMPRIYGLSILSSAVDMQTAKAAISIEVHRDRIVHVKDCSLDSNVYGYPILERVYNSMDDAEKTVGGSAEMFWLNGRGGMHIDVAKDTQFNADHAKDLRQQVDDFMNDLTRVLRTRGVDIKQLSSQSVNPAPVFDVVMSMISIATGIPQRIFIGSEQGKLASEQDRANWAVRISDRRVIESGPEILRPLVNRFQQFGVVPKRDYELDWPEAFIQSPLELAQTSAQKARAATNIVRAGKDFATPIEGVDYPISRPGQTVVGGGAPGKPTFHASAENKKAKVLDTTTDKSKDKIPAKIPGSDAENKDTQAPAPKPIVIPNESITVPRRVIVTPTEMRQIIFAEGDLRSAGTIDESGDVK